MSKTKIQGADSQGQYDAIQLFDDSLTAIGSMTEFAQFLRAREAFKHVVNLEFVRSVVVKELTLLADQPQSDVNRNRDQIVVVSRASWSLAIRRLEANVPMRPTLLSTTTHSMFGFVVCPPGMSLHRYAFAAPTVEVFDPSVRLRPIGAVPIAEGSVVTLEAGRDVYHFPRFTAPALCVLLQSETAVPYRWEFDSATLAPTTMLSSDLEQARLLNITRYLASCGDDESLRHLCDLATYPDHVVRWTAVRAAAALDAETGTELLRQMTTDPHPHIRLVAAQSLAAVEGSTNGAHV